MSGPRQEKKNHSTQGRESETREKILQAATKVFARKGYSATIEQIAEVMGASKGNIYYYFESKQVLLFHLLKRSMHILLEGARLIDDSPADRRLKKLLRDHIIHLCHNQDLMTIMMDLHRELSPEQWQEVVNLRDAYEAKIQSIIKEGIEKGFFLPYDEKVLSYSLLGSVNWVYTWYNPEGRLKPEEIAEIISEHLMKGIRRGINLDFKLGQTIEEISIGDSASFSKTISDADIYLFAGITGDFNPMHVSDEFARLTPYGGRIAHGGITNSLIAPVLGTILPGLGTVALETNCKYLEPVYPGDTITATAKVVEKDEQKNTLTMELTWTNQEGKVVASGQAKVKPPAEDLKRTLGQW